MGSVGLQRNRLKTQYLPPISEDNNIWMKKYKSEKRKITYKRTV